MKPERGILLVVSGPAGSGKGTVNAHLRERDEFSYSISATTRNPRPGIDAEGVTYHFITKEQFEAEIAAGRMLEYAEYCNNYYGTPLAPIETTLASGRNMLLEIEVEGAMQVKRRMPEAVLVMLLPPNHKAQEDRLRGRGTEDEATILKRLDRTREELKHLDAYDYIVYNEDGKSAEAAQKLLDIVSAARCARSRYPSAAQDYFAGETGSNP